MTHFLAFARFFDLTVGGQPGDLLVTGLGCKQIRDAYEIIGDQIEHEVSGDAGDTTMLGLARGTVLLASSENTLNHGVARLRHAVAVVPGRAGIDGTAAAPACRGEAVILRHMRGDIEGA